MICFKKGLCCHFCGSYLQWTLFVSGRVRRICPRICFFCQDGPGKRLWVCLWCSTITHTRHFWFWFLQTDKSAAKPRTLYFVWTSLTPTLISFHKFKWTRMCRFLSPLSPFLFHIVHSRGMIPPCPRINFDQYDSICFDLLSQTGWMALRVSRRE